MSQPLNPADVRQLIQTTLQPLNLYSTDVEELILFTFANESDFGTYRTQGGGGPARGIGQMEGPTFNDVWTNYLAYHPALAQQISALFQNQPPSVDELVNNDAAAIAMCRIQYLRAPEAIPPANDVEAIWTLYKKRYNTPMGAATHDRAMQAYQTYVVGK